MVKQCFEVNYFGYYRSMQVAAHRKRQPPTVPTLACRTVRLCDISLLVRPLCRFCTNRPCAQAAVAAASCSLVRAVISPCYCSPVTSLRRHRRRCPRTVSPTTVGVRARAPACCAITSQYCSYMGTKWAVEALCQTLRLECKLTRKRIDVCMLNPGFVQPTGLMKSGLDIIEQSFKEAPPAYKQEYKWMIDNFVDFSKAPPITSPPIACAVAMHDALTDHTARLRYCVGFDSKVRRVTCGV